MKTYHDIVGDGGSRVLEQVAAQRQRIADNLGDIRSIVAVGSGKGGVGKSSVTVQLAAAAARAGQSTAILDADFNGPTQARLTGIGRVQPVPGKQGLVLPRNDAGIGVVSVGSIVPETEALEFDNVAPGESHTWRATREFSTLAEMLGSVEWGFLDLLLIDLPPGAERTLQFAEFLGPDVTFVLVTIPRTWPAASSRDRSPLSAPRRTTCWATSRT